MLEVGRRQRNDSEIGLRMILADILSTLNTRATPHTSNSRFGNRSSVEHSEGTSDRCSVIHPVVVSWRCSPEQDSESCLLLSAGVEERCIQ